MLVSGLHDRLIEAFYSGNVELIQVLFDSCFLKPTDTLDLTGSNRHQSSDAVSMLHVVARRPCPDFKYLIDILLDNNVPLDDGMPLTPLEEAIQNKNFSTAAYLESKGATYCLEEVASFLNEYENYKLNLPISKTH